MSGATLEGLAGAAVEALEGSAEALDVFRDFAGGGSLGLGALDERTRLQLLHAISAHLRPEDLRELLRMDPRRYAQGGADCRVAGPWINPLTTWHYRASLGPNPLRGDRELIEVKRVFGTSAALPLGWTVGSSVMKRPIAFLNLDDALWVADTFLRVMGWVLSPQPDGALQAMPNLTIGQPAVLLEMRSDSIGHVTHTGPIVGIAPSDSGVAIYKVRFARGRYAESPLCVPVGAVFRRQDAQ